MRGSYGSEIRTYIVYAMWLTRAVTLDCTVLNASRMSLGECMRKAGMTRGGWVKQRGPWRHAPFVHSAASERRAGQRK